MASASIRMCSCGFATNDDDWLEGHLFENPSHHERRTLERLLRFVANAR
jgi:hypothetical protein